MTILYFSTVFRTAPIATGGELIQLDWDSKRIMARVPIVPEDPPITDPNPRGGTRGGRGILVTSDEIYVASYHSLHVFDRDLRPKRWISHPLFADLHELAWDDDAIWVTSTVLDCAIKVDKFGRTLDSWWPREDPVVSRRFNLPPLPLDKSRDNRLSYLGQSHKQAGHTHLNTVAMFDGRPLVLLNQFGCVVQLNPTRVLFEDPRLHGAHNLLVTRAGQILINDTVHQEIAVFDFQGRAKKRIKLKQFWPVKKIRLRFCLRGLRLWLGERSPSFKVKWFLIKNITASRPVFVRGLCETPRGTVLVGISPASILEIDLKSGTLIDSFNYSTNVNCAIHGLICGESIPWQHGPARQLPSSEGVAVGAN